MSQHVVRLHDLVIPNTQTDSNIYIASRDFRDADAIGIFAPDTLPETVTVHVDSEETAVNFNPLSRDGVDVTIPAGKHITIELPAFKALKLVAGAGVGGDRTFKVNKLIWA